MITALSPLFAYNYNRDAYVLRLVGRRVGPVLKRDRRRRREPPVEGVDMRRRSRLTQRLAG